LSLDLPGLELELDVTEVEGWIWKLGQTEREKRISILRP